MSPSYNEEELVLRLLIGIVFPVLVLVVLKMTRLGLRKREARWRRGALAWARHFFGRAGVKDPEVKARKGVATLLGLERVLAFAAAVVLLSVAWFVLFPQTRSLATEFVQAILSPVLDLLGKMLQGLLLVLYSAALFLGALFGSRYLARGVGRRWPHSLLALPLFSVPARIALWLAAAFLFLLPYPGMPRIFALGLLLLALLLIILASRPLLEELAAGFYLQNSLRLEKGERIDIEGKSYRILDLRPLQALLEREGEAIYLPYSRIMKAEIAREEDSAHGED